MKNDYELLDSGEGRKLERFGSFVIARPCAQAVWKQALSEKDWERADAIFTREPENRWIKKKALPATWKIDVDGLIFQLSTTDFGHLGIFPEQRDSWSWIKEIVQTARKSRGSEIHVLNLFAYSGGSTLAAAQAGAQVCHLDASKGMVDWARENAALNGLEKAPIRWIVDDVAKFLKRELRRERLYDAIILDPPTFGRGAKGELFKIESDLLPILNDCKALLSEHPLFILFSCHTPGYTPIAMHHLMSQMMKAYPGLIQSGEMVLRGKDSVFSIPSGTYAYWCREKK